MSAPDLPTHHARLRRVVAERGWDALVDLRGLVLALTGEVGEVAELVQWLPDAAVADALARPGFREELGAELADVLHYLLRLADAAGVDLLAAADRKLGEVEAKYPVERARGTTAKYTDLR